MFVAAPHFRASLLTASVVLGTTDPGSSRLVYAMVIGLVLVGIALVVLGIWIVRQTRPDLEVLAPLERMGDRDWKKRDPATQRRMLDELRPDGAEPLAAQAPPPPLDGEFEQSDHPVSSLSDLGPGVLAEGDPPAGSQERGVAADEPDTVDAGSAVDDDEAESAVVVEVGDAESGIAVGDDEAESAVEVEVDDADSGVAVGDDDAASAVDVEVDDAGSVVDVDDAAEESVTGGDDVEDAADDGDERSDEAATVEEPPVGANDEHDDVAADHR